MAFQATRHCNSFLVTPPQHRKMRGSPVKRASRVLLTIALWIVASPAFANVVVSSPQDGETVAAAARFVATANTAACRKGVASMGVYVDNRLEYVVNGTSLNTSIPLSPGAHKTVLQEWDYCGGATTTARTVIVSDQATVSVASPSNHSTLSSLANYVATATTNCPAGIAAMGIYVNSQRVFLTQGAKLNTQLTLSPGAQHTVVQEWDACGGSKATPIDLTVVAPTNQNTFSNLQMSPGWKSSGQIAPLYNDCGTSCPGVTWSMAQGISSPSLTGKAAEMNLGGTTPYSDVLFYNQLIGSFSTQGLPDLSHKILPTLHNFTYDAYFYVADAAHTQAMEFDINWFMNSVGITWGTECRIYGGNEWDIWDNVNSHWVPTGFACNPLPNAWNHVTVNAQRADNGNLIYQSITLNGLTANINKTYAPFWVPANWYGVTVNYQMDGDEKQTAIRSYLDNFSLTYW